MDVAGVGGRFLAGNRNSTLRICNKNMVKGTGKCL